MLSSIWTNLGPLTHTLNVVPTATGYKNGLAVQPSFRKALEQEGFGPSGREQLKAFRDAEVHRLHEFVHEIGIDRKAGQTNDIKDMREYKDAMEYIENRKSNQIVKMQREEKAHEEKMHELDERLRKQEEMIQKRDEAFKASKREQARIIKEYNDEIVSKSEELDLEMIKDDTVDAMLNDAARSRISQSTTSATIKSKKKALARKNNAT